MVGPLQQIIAAARLAPSGDNTQPVRFEISGDGRTVGVQIDPSRDPSPMNSGQKMARMAAGASLETLIQAAEAHGFGAEVETTIGRNLAVVRLLGEGSGKGQDSTTFATRVTNRRVYDGSAMGDSQLEVLKVACPPLERVTTHWIVDRERIEGFADLIGKADALMFGEPTMRAAFLAKVRFDRPIASEVEEGLSLGSLEIGLADRLSLRAMRRIPDRLIKLGNAPAIFARKARILVSSSSGLCLVVGPDDQDATDVNVGRALQRAWLALAAEGLATQPMMSLLVLENVNDRGEPSLNEALGPAKLLALRQRFRSLAPEIDGRRPAWLLRFGHARPPTGRSGRLPVEAIVIRTEG